MATPGKWSEASSWDPSNWEGLGSVPIIGEAWNMIGGNPDAIKSAYDQQIAASQQAQQQMQQFLMGKKGEAQAIYAPLKHMYQNTYGTEGVRPQESTRGPLAQMYGGK